MAHHGARSTTSAPRVSSRGRWRSLRGCGDVRDGEFDAAGVAAAFDEDFGFEQAAELQARAFPRLEVVGDGDGAALARGLADAPVLVPLGDAAAARAAGAVGLVLEEFVAGAVHGGGAFLGGVVGVEGHGAPTIIDDVPLDTRVGGPAVDSNVGVPAGAAALLVAEVCLDGAVLAVGLAAVAEFEADARAEVAVVAEARA